MWKTGEKPFEIRVIGGPSAEWKQAKSGKHCPSFDILAMTIYSPSPAL
jgi:hypothetical protein